MSSKAISFNKQIQKGSVAMKATIYFANILLALSSFRSAAFAPQWQSVSQSATFSHKVDHAITIESSCAPSNTRRHFFKQQLLVASSALAPQFLSAPAHAKGTEAEDKAKILEGYKRLGYLLDNWDKLTTFCDGTKKDPFTNKIVCERTPLVVQEYMGYKSINDPLFKADKTLLRLEPLVPASKEVDFLECLEKWQATADEASGMAYTSSWAGPQNPNGGDDAIDYYLERAKKQVQDARATLGNVISILDLNA